MSNFLTDLFGSKPQLPSWTSLDLGTEQQKALTENLAAAPKATQLANLTEQQLLSMMRTTFPNFDEVSKTVSGNTLSELQGQIPKDVQESIQTSAAARSIGSGTAGTDFARNLVARDLGLTSLDLTNKGLASAESWLKASEQLLAPAAQVYTSMFVTPGQQAGFDVNERNMQFEHDWLGAQIAAMPDPTTVGLWNASWSVVDSVLSAYTGSNVTAGQINPQGPNYPQMGFGGFGGSPTSYYGQNAGSAETMGWGGNTGESINIYNDPSQSGGSFTDIAATGG